MNSLMRVLRRAPILLVALLAVCIEVAPQPASAIDWQAPFRNLLIKGKLEVQDGACLTDTNYAAGLTIGDSLKVAAAGKLAKDGSFSVNADSTVTIDGATTVNAAASFTQPVTMDSLQVYALCGEYEMTADTDSITVAGLLTTDICLWNFSLTPIADFTVTCEAGQLKLAGTSASGSKVHYMVVRPGS